jgi:hypothetical protein
MEALVFYVKVQFWGICAPRQENYEEIESGLLIIWLRFDWLVSEYESQT